MPPPFSKAIHVQYMYFSSCLCRMLCILTWLFLRGLINGFLLILQTKIPSFSMSCCLFFKEFDVFVERREFNCFPNGNLLWRTHMHTKCTQNVIIDSWRPVRLNPDLSLRHLKCWNSTVWQFGTGFHLRVFCNFYNRFRLNNHMIYTCTVHTSLQALICFFSAGISSKGWA